MNDDEVREALLNAVPPLTTPTDRLGEISRRVRRRRAWYSAASIAAVATVGGMVVAVPGLLFSGGENMAMSTGVGVSTSALVPQISRSPRGALPERTFSFDGGRCPSKLNLTSVAGGSNRPAGTSLAKPLTRVIVCRYRHAAFDLSVGDADLIAGPRSGDPQTFQAAVNLYLDLGAFRPSATVQPAGCQGPSPSENYSVDIVATWDTDSTLATYMYHRMICQNADGMAALRGLNTAVDALLGPPY
jgi:hypothetical protein